MTHLWEASHAYYCNEGNYFSNDTVTEYRSWSEFVASEGDSDMDYNLVFRWDWKLIDDTGDGHVAHPEDDNYRGYRLSIFWMGQRKGLFRTTITDVCRADEDAVITFLAPRWDHLQSLWAPLVASLPSFVQQSETDSGGE